MKEIVWKCDPCTSRGEDSTATHVVPVTIGTGKERLLDLCDADYARLLQPVVEALKEFGYTDDVPAKPKRKTSAAVPAGSMETRTLSPYDEVGPYQCGLCPTQPKHGRSFSNHVRQVHNITMTAYRSEHGDPKLVA